MGAGWGRKLHQLPWPGSSVEPATGAIARLLGIVQGITVGGFFGGIVVIRREHQRWATGDCVYCGVDCRM